jgi:hypothetical protein
MAPAIAAVTALSSARAGPGNATRVSPARTRRCPVDRWVRAPRKASARPSGGEAPAGGGSGAGRGALAPGWSCCQRGDVAAAMAPAIAAGAVLSSVRAGTGNAPRFPARAERCPTDRQVGEQRRPAPDPAGAKRPPGAGRALAGGCGPRPVKDQRGAVAGAIAPAIAAVTALLPVRAGSGNAARFPRPRGTLPQRSGATRATEASARPGGREAPAGGGAGACLSESCRPCRLMGLVRGDGDHRPPGLAGCGPCRALVQGTGARGIAPAFRPVPDGDRGARPARQARE